MKLREIVLLGTLGASLMGGCASKQIEFKDPFDYRSRGCVIENLNKDLNENYQFIPPSEHNKHKPYEQSWSIELLRW